MFFDQWSESDVRAMVRRGRIHPSVFMWSLGNEIPDAYHEDGIATLRRLIEICREEDSTRPITLAAEGQCRLPLVAGVMGQLDVPGYNYIDLRHPDTFYGAVRAQHAGKAILGTETNYSLAHWRFTRDHAYVLGQFLWVGMDYLGEGHAASHGWSDGLVHITGQPKADYHLWRSLWSDSPVLALAVVGDHKPAGIWALTGTERHWNWQAGRRAIKAFTNCPSVELFLNGRSLGVQERAGGDIQPMEWLIDFEPGILHAKGIRDGRVICEDRLITAGIANRLEIAADRTALLADGQDLAHLMVRVVDIQGIPVPGYQGRISLEVSGSVSLAGIIAPDFTNPLPYQSGTREFTDHCLVVVRARHHGGTGAIVISVDGLPSERVQLFVDKECENE